MDSELANNMSGLVREITNGIPIPECIIKRRHYRGIGLQIPWELYDSIYQDVCTSIYQEVYPSTSQEMYASTS